MFPQDLTTRQTITKWSIFTPIEVGGTGNVQSWQKPFGCSWVYVLLIGAGGGGGMPTNGARTTAAGGGGSGAISRILVPAWAIPDTLYINVVRGGAGAIIGGNGTSAGDSFVTVTRDTGSVSSRLLFADGGGGGSGGTGTAGGVAGVVMGNTDTVHATFGVWQSIAGQAGANGSASAGGAVSNITWGANGAFTCGGGGGGCGTANGGGISGATAIGVPSRTGGAANTGNAGDFGFKVNCPLSTTFIGSILPPLLFTGGAGGGGRNVASTTAGAGGVGAYGCGGGGGGSGTLASNTSGNGGNGGDAICFIGAF